MLYPLVAPFIQFILWLHLAVNPMQTIQVNTANQATVLEAVSASHKVKTGFVCSSYNDIQCVDGLCNKDGKYWTIELNGNYESVNSRSKVYPSDKLVLKYASSKGR